MIRDHFRVLKFDLADGRGEVVTLEGRDTVAGGSGLAALLFSGQGLGTTLLAAAYPKGRFWGFDFNPGQVAHARGLASEAELGNVAFGGVKADDITEADDDTDGGEEPIPLPTS